MAPDNSKNKGNQQASNKQNANKKQSGAGKQQHDQQQPASGNGHKKAAAASNGQKSSPAKSPIHAPLTTGEKVFAGFLFFSALTMVLGASHLAYNGRLSVLQPRDRKAALDSLTSFSGKLEFTAKFWILGLVWLYFHLHVLIMNRLANKATNPLSGHEDRVQAEKNVFNNSMEQFLLSIVSQTAVLPYLTASQVLSVIPLFNGFFFVGRVLFWLGYPKRRSFGFTTSMVPSSIAILFSAYQFAVRLDLNPDSLFKLNL